MIDEISDEEIENVAAALHEYDRRRQDVNFWNDSHQKIDLYRARAAVAIKAYLHAAGIDENTIITIRKVDR